ncbi:MAG TPA: hypothetical protein GXX70_06840 [Tepidimicrobium sp.]|nr:hypothetical protein [Tepidimicrobium sp.]
MWTTVYLATGLEQAIKVEEQLRNEGFMVKKNLLYKDGDEDLYEILTPKFEADDVRMVLFDLGIF